MSATQLPPPHIEQEFRLHSCELHLCERFSDVEIHRIERWPEEGRNEIRTKAYDPFRR